MKLGRQLHQAQGLTITLGIGHAEIAVQVVPDTPSFLLPHDHHPLAIDDSQATHHRFVVAKVTVAVQLEPVLRNALNIIQCIRAFGMASHLHPLPTGQAIVKIGGGLGQLILETLDLPGHIDPPLQGRDLGGLDLLLEFPQRLFKFQDVFSHSFR